ncbi:WD40/YVTN/BNR-like repeat-containing protein [Nannocystis pusilla]|uniref:WD40/YVTN/BNR-like repeat-containing protein n=1 Tax=Nannocystis pusilla TaxID=889268 RepID=UPI003DA59656
MHYSFLSSTMTRATAAAVSLTVMACGDAGGASETDAPGSETEPATSGDTSTTTGADTTGVPTTSEATGETSTGTTTGDAPADDLLVVAVGEQGSILHCREDGCESMPSPVSTELDDVVVLAADRAFAVGSAGVVLAWDGAAWTAMDAPTTANLSAIAALDDQTLFVGGSDGTMLRWDGATWTEVEHPVHGVKEQTVHEIAFAGPDFGLAVVSSFSELGQSSILRWDGASWTSEREGMDNMLSSLAVASPAVAAAGGYAPTPDEPLNLLTRDGQATWTRVEDIEERNFVTGVSFTSESFGMAVTDRSFGPRPPVLALWDGETWTTQDVPDPHTAVVLVDAELGFLVGWGDDAGAFVQRWKAGELTRLPTDSSATALWGIDGIRLP